MKTREENENHEKREHATVVSFIKSPLRNLSAAHQALLSIVDAACGIVSFWS